MLSRHCGLAYLYAFDAPARLIAVDAGALTVALVWVLFGPLPQGRKACLALAGGAALVELAAVSAVLTFLQRGIGFAIVTVGAAVLSVMTYGAGTLEPQVFTENVLPQVATRSALLAAALALERFPIRMHRTGRSSLLFYRVFRAAG
ncbi:MAG: hypothetical protein ACK4IC_02930 [Erythrobacter sp.]